MQTLIYIIYVNKQDINYMFIYFLNFKAKIYKKCSINVATTHWNNVELLTLTHRRDFYVHSTFKSKKVHQFQRWGTVYNVLQRWYDYVVCLKLHSFRFVLLFKLIYLVAIEENRSEENLGIIPEVSENKVYYYIFLFDFLCKLTTEDLYEY